MPNTRAPMNLSPSPQLEALARRVVAHLDGVFREPPLPPDPVRLVAFPHLDKAWYAASTARLERLGFRHLRDLDGSTVAGPDAPAPVVRVLLSADGTTGAALYHLRPVRLGLRVKVRLWLASSLPKAQHIVEFTTWTADGVVSTSNQGTGVPFDAPPWMVRERLALGTPVETVLARHLVLRPESARAFRDFDDLYRARDEHRLRVQAWRRAVSLSPDEITRVLSSAGAAAEALRPYFEQELLRQYPRSRPV